MLYPVPPVMISCADEEGRSNIMTAAWAGTICSDPVMVSVSIRPERYSHDIIERTGEFVINLTTEGLTYAADFCGVRSGRDVDKFEYLHLTKVPSQRVSAPSIGESPVCLECVVTAVEKLGLHDMFIAKVVAVSVDEQYLDQNGRFALERAGLTAYVHGSYFSLGKKIGTFGYSVRKKGSGRKNSRILSERKQPADGSSAGGSEKKHSRILSGKKQPESGLPAGGSEKKRSDARSTQKPGTRKMKSKRSGRR